MTRAVNRSRNAMALGTLERRILSIYQRDTRIAADEIGARVGLPAAAVQRHIKRMRENGVITAETATLKRRKLGLGVTAIVHVDLVDESARSIQAFRDKIAVRDDVQQCYGVTGTADYALIVVVTDLAAYDALCNACLLHDTNVRSFTTHIVLDELKRTGIVDIPLD